MRQIVKVDKAAVGPIVSKTFPFYSGKDFRLVPTTSVTCSGTEWKSGSRNAYAVIRLAERKGKVFPSRDGWKNVVEGECVAIGKQIAVVEHSIFQGDDLGIRIYLHPDHCEKLLLQLAA